jgi:hypothetical protein
MRKQYLHLSAYPLTRVTARSSLARWQFARMKYRKKPTSDRWELSAWRAAIGKTPGPRLPVICCRWSGRPRMRPRLLT